jgi:hypothetical protein
MSDESGHLHGKNKTIWTFVKPIPEGLQLRKPVKSNVQFKGIEAGAIILKPIFFGE